MECRDLGDGGLEHARGRSTPSCVNRRRDGSSSIEQEDGHAVCRHDTDQPARRSDDEPVGLRPLVGRGRGDHANAVHLARHHERHGGARARDHGIPAPGAGTITSVEEAVPQARNGGPRTVRQHGDAGTEGIPWLFSAP